jgi:hypothetical protein
MNFFLEFLDLFLQYVAWKSNFVSFPTFTIQYITYPVLTSTNFYPLFKGRDTTIFNFSIYHVFILGIKYYPNNAKNMPYGTVHLIYPYYNTYYITVLTVHIIYGIRNKS